MAVKNIIFDLGGVIFNIDYRLTESAFIKLGCTNFAELYSQAKQTALFDDFEEGKIDEIVFFYKLKQLSGLESTFQELKDAWNSMLLGLPEDKIQMLKSLQGKYRLFLLSNTNQTHLSAVIKHIEKVCAFSEFESLFEKTYYSNSIGLKKPNVAPFLKILIENNLSAEETLFIDDSVQHVEGASKTGIRGEWLQKPMETEKLLKDLKLV